MFGHYVARMDYMRRSPFPHGGAQGHKEWLHFCIYGPGFDVLVNFSLVDDVTAGAPAGRELARTVVLVRDREACWDGDVDLFAPPEVSVSGGRVGARFGANEVVFRDGVYRLSARLKRRKIAIQAELVPLTIPSPAYNVEVGDGPPINWLVMPRLSASGRIDIEGRVFEFSGAPAYHDHNWGHFRWGRDFAWEWGFGLPPEESIPWTVVFVRLSNRAHTSALTQALFVWNGARQHRVFRGSEVVIRHEGLLGAKRVFKLPRPMALLAPGLATDVPSRFVIRAAGGGDSADCTFAAEDVAQVIIPNDDDLGVTIIHEVKAMFRFSGRIRGEEVAFDGGAIFELLGA